MRLRKKNLEDALRGMVKGYEADCRCRSVSPNDVMKNHTWLALAYKEAKALLDPKPERIDTATDQSMSYVGHQTPDEEPKQ